MIANAEPTFDFEAKTIKDVESAQRILDRTISRLQLLSSMPVDAARSARLATFFKQAASIKGAIIRAKTSQFMEGIRTAARKKEGKPPRAIIETLIVEKTAERLKGLFPQILRLHLVGSRLRHRYGRDLEFVAVVENEQNMPGRNLVNAIDSKLKVDLFFSLPEEIETHILEFGLGFDIMRWKKTAIKKGYKLNRYGLFKKGLLVSRKMAEIAQLIGMPLKPHLVASLENPY